MTGEKIMNTLCRAIRNQEIWYFILTWEKFTLPFKKAFKKYTIFVLDDHCHFFVKYALTADF